MSASSSFNPELSTELCSSLTLTSDFGLTAPTGITSKTTLVQFRPLSYTFPASATPTSPLGPLIATLILLSPSASSQTSLLAPTSNCGQSTVTLCPSLPGVTAGVAKDTFTVSNRWFFSVKTHWCGRWG